ncbi:DUF1611 domain-containing protein [Catalinimonas niigatensis]|uniref:DUF1611 domain-containing protein n=1 Tax=Catalinimonas niigatensis TaxID=1397264 RepID=UPI0026653DD0|nr:DUF1611 domain-containing protein [Catalinimonas niigatensis]WPP48553.1 DUF1611 domain-containing protein [Catalinimonas niigatensis]
MEGNAIVITQGYLATPRAKTAHGLIRDTSKYKILAVIDHQHAGQDAGEIVDGKRRGIPVFGDLTTFLSTSSEKAMFCLVGVAGKGGLIPEGMLDTVKDAIRAGMSIVSGLHEFMSDIPELITLAEEHKVTITDIRKPKPRHELKFWTGRIKQVRCPKIAILGTDCNLGKRTTTRLLMHALQQADIRAEMIYTGQTGWMQGSAFGFIFDSTFNDFISGELEDAIVRCWDAVKPDVILLEGQSSLRNPSGPGGSEFLLSGEARHVILQHAPGRKYFHHFDEEQLEIPSLESEVKLIEMYGAKVFAITLNEQNLSPEQAQAYKTQYEQALGIPVLIPLQESLDSLAPIIQKMIETYED